MNVLLRAARGGRAHLASLRNPGAVAQEECVRVGGGVVREPGFRNVGAWKRGAKGVLWSPGSALFGPVGGKGLHQGKGGFSEGVGPCFHLRSPRRSSEPGRDRTFLSFLARKPGNQISKSASFQAQPVLSNRPLPQDFPEKLSCAKGATLRLLRSLLPLNVPRCCSSPWLWVTSIF